MAISETTERKSGAAVLVQRMVRHPVYVICVILVVMPMIGSIMERGQVWLGLALLAMQTPWAMCRAYDIMPNADVSDPRHATPDSRI